jgi:hypothetical protein
LSSFDQISAWVHAKIFPHTMRGDWLGGTQTFTQEGAIMNADQLKGKWKQLASEVDAG